MFAWGALMYALGYAMHHVSSRVTFTGRLIIFTTVAILSVYFLMQLSLAMAPKTDFVYYQVGEYKLWGVFIGDHAYYSFDASDVEAKRDITNWMMRTFGGPKKLAEKTRSDDRVLLGIWSGEHGKTPAIISEKLSDVMFFESKDNVCDLNTKYYIPRQLWEMIIMIPVRYKILYHVYSDFVNPDYDMKMYNR